MPLEFQFFLLTLFGLVTVGRYVAGALLKWFVPSARLKKDYSLTPTVSILMPCYNEGRTVYETVESISKSDYPADKFEIIAIDDGSKDDSFEWLLKAQADFSNVRASRNAVNSGKAQTVINALLMSSADIAITIDSDCIFASNTVRELVACFADPKIGAVGGRVGTRNTNENLFTMAQTCLYYTTFHLNKMVENWTRSVCIISGCLLAIRREIYLKAKPAIEERNWLGVHVNEGEDRFLTHQVLLQGYGTGINTDAQCWTTVPSTFSQLWKQQLRWRRSALRDFFMTVRMLPEHVRIVHPNTLLNMLLPTLTMLLSLALLFLAPFSTPLFWAAPTFLLAHAIIAGVLHLIIRKYQPEQTIKEPWLLPLAGAWTLVNVFLTLVALCTFDGSEWGTRGVSSLSPNPVPKRIVFETEPLPDFVSGSVEQGRDNV